MGAMIAFVIAKGSHAVTTFLVAIWQYRNNAGTEATSVDDAGPVGWRAIQVEVGPQRKSNAAAW